MEQPDLFETEAARSLLDQLLADSRLYHKSADFVSLLDFVVRLRNFAPFNAMLLQLQKPGLSYAASACDWRERFGRVPKDGARPLVILWPFGPVAFVYDVMDTEGNAVPVDVASFVATGNMDGGKIAIFDRLVSKRGIELAYADAGDRSAGSIRVIKRGNRPGEASHYRLHINRNHGANVQFATLAHELGHLFLGHLGPDKVLNIPRRAKYGHSQEELEAESVAYLVCARNGVAAKSQSYLKNFVKADTTAEHLDLYQIMRAAGQAESLLGLTAHTKYELPKLKCNKGDGGVAAR